MNQNRNNKNRTKGLEKLQTFSLATLALGGLLLFPNSSNAQTFNLQQSYFHPNLSNNLNSLYGTSVVLGNGNNFVIGAPSQETSNSATPAVFYYENGVLTQTYTNTTNALSQTSRFGNSVSLSGSNILVGAWQNNNSVQSSGQGFLFTTGNTTAQRIYNSLNPTSNGQFARSTAISGTNVVIGAWNENNGNGNAYLGSTTNNTLFPLTVPSGNTGQFGFSVSVNGNNIIIGAPFANTITSNTGAAYLFNNTIYQRTFSNSLTGSEFGYSVDVNDNFVAVGARAQNNNGIANNGAVYLFNLNGNSIGTIVNPQATANEGYFGSSVALANNEVLIGAPGNFDVNGSRSGAAYLYSISNQALLQTFFSPTNEAGGNNNDNFGESVDYNGQYVLIGEPGDDTNGNDSGAAHLYASGLNQQEVPEGNAIVAIILAGLSLLGLRKKK